MESLWKDVVGFEAYFKVSEYGEVFSKRTKRVLKQCVSKSGYRTISTRLGGRNGTCYCFKVHRLVADAFLEPPATALVEKCSTQGCGVVLVRHLDNNKLNCHYSNLLWGYLSR